jgi:hypothetical protein
MRISALLLTMAFAPLAIGCGGSGIEKFPVAKTTGRVMCEGKPVAQAHVFFEPLETGASANVGKGAFAVTDESGAFTLSTYGNGDGAVVGKHRVRVDGPNKSQCECVLNSERDVMQVEIKDGEKNEFEVVLPKKTARDKALGADEDDEV